jgi:hypothetical protein
MERKLAATGAFGDQLFGPTRDPYGHGAGKGGQNIHLHVPTPGGKFRMNDALAQLMGGGGGSALSSQLQTAASPVRPTMGASAGGDTAGMVRVQEQLLGLKREDASLTEKLAKLNIETAAFDLQEIARGTSRTTELQQQLDLENSKLKAIEAAAGLGDNQLALTHKQLEGQAQINSLLTAQKDAITKINASDQLSDAEKKTAISLINKGMSQRILDAQKQVKLDNEILKVQQQQALALDAQNMARQLANTNAATNAGFRGGAASKYADFLGDAASAAIAASLQKSIDTAQTAQADTGSLEEQVRQLQAGVQELSTLDQLLVKYGADWALIDPAVKGHLVDLARQKDALTEMNRGQQEMIDLYNGIGTTIQTGLVDGLMAAVSGTEDLGQAMQKLGADLLATIGKMLIVSAISNALKGLGGGEGAGIFTALAGGIGKRAAGGPISAGNPYLVGEEGPELILPGTSGTVVPNDIFAATREALSSGAAGDSATGSAENGDVTRVQSARAFAANGDALTSTARIQKERMLERQYMSTASGSATINVQTQVINGVEYATVAQLNETAQASARKARAQVFSDLKHKPSVRSQVGLR